MQLDCGLSSKTTKASARRSRVKLFLLATSVAMLIAPSAALADASFSPGLRAQAAANPGSTFNVIVQGEQAGNSRAVGHEVHEVAKGHRNHGLGLRRSFKSIDGVSAELTGAQILELADSRGIVAITEDTPVHVTTTFSNNQLWPYSSEVAPLWPTFATGSTKAPTIAVVDSGIDTTRRDFGSRIMATVNLSSLPNNSPGDGRGHGTFVASIAAGSVGGYAGAAPSAKLVSLDVIDDRGWA